MPVVSMALRPHLPGHTVGSPTPDALLEPQLLLNASSSWATTPRWCGLPTSSRAWRSDGSTFGAGAWACGSSRVGRSWRLRRRCSRRALLARSDAATALASTYPDPSVGADPAALDAALTHGLHGTTPTGSWWWLATVAPHSGTPLDLAQTIGSAMAVLGLCLLVTRFQPRVWAAAFGAGAMTLSLYSLHVVLMGRGWWPELETQDHYDDQVLIVLGIGAVLALVPLRGPIETVVAVASRAAAARLGEPNTKPTPTTDQRPRQ